MNQEEIALVVVGVIASVILFFVGREIVCWYFKVNEIVKLLREIRDSLKK